MTSNNLEAIERIQLVIERLGDQGFSMHGNTISDLGMAIRLLQANEVEVSEEEITQRLGRKCKDCSTNHWGSCMELHKPSDEVQQEPLDCGELVCTQQKPCKHYTPKPTKETKLRELKKSILYGTTEPGGGLMELISILLEEEY